jgi:glycosyltransferase involved in cell wall biosynthesis
MGSILRAATRKPGESLNILTACTHERWESNWSRSGHAFYAIRTPQVKDWNRAFAPLPENYTLFDPARGPRQIPSDIEFDLVVSQNRFGGFQLLAPIANAIQVPLLTIEHTLNYPDWPPEYLARLKALRGHVNVFISEFSRKSWGWGEDEALVVHHGVDTDVFSPAQVERKKHVLSVVNQFREPARLFCCGYPFWQEATRGLPWHHLGESFDGWSKPAESIPALVRAYRECAVFVDTAAASPIPTVVLEAMSVGCVVVSRGNSMVPEVIQDGVNGFIRADPKDMRELLADILARPEKYEHVRERARRTVLERFSLERFVRDWDTVLRTAANTPWARLPLR